MDNTALFEERQNRIAQAVRLEKPDRVPVVMLYNSFAARVLNMPLSEFVKSSMTAAKAMLEVFDKIGPADGIDFGSYYAKALPLLWLSKVQLPGKELPDNAAWQIHEQELMKPEDYDQIVNEGWPNWFPKYINERIDPNRLREVTSDSQDVPAILELWRAKGIPTLCSGMCTIPFEMICGGRSFAKFMHDLFTMPVKVKAAFDAMMPFMTPQALNSSKELGTQYIWVGGWRSASAMISPRLWDQFVFPYYEKVIAEVLDAGIVPILHFDSDWNRDLDRFKVFPKGRCIFAPDSMTNIFKAKEVLGDTMCIMGDVPAAMLSLGTPDEVYKYCRKLIDELGPTGFILHSGCDIPQNAKLENVIAMVESVQQ